MRRACAIALLLLASTPAQGARVDGPADQAAGLWVDVPEGTQVTVSCSAPGPAVEGYFAGFTITNASGPKAGRINSMVMGAYAKNGDAFVYVSAGDASDGRTVPLGLPRPTEPWEITLGAAYPSYLRIGSASWGAATPCTFAIDDVLVELPAIASGAARALRASDFGGGVGFDSTLGDVSIDQTLTADAHGYLMGMLACSTGTASAAGPEGQRYSVDNPGPAAGPPIVLATETSGSWTYVREACVDAFAPVLWTVEIPAP